MKRVLILGAGRSTSSLVGYLSQHAAAEDWQIVLGDRNELLARSKAGESTRVQTAYLDASDHAKREEYIAAADLVVSMLPAFMHPMVARDCVRLGKHLVTASYQSDEMLALDEEARSKGLILMNETGVDPGIDHMSAMQMIDEIRRAGGEIIRFESFTGGLPAPESDDNPWHYKFSWNPRNVVLAGMGGAVQFRQEGKYKYIPYTKLFQRTEFIDIEGYGRFEGYANRDSLRYRNIYGLDDIQTIYRGTFRRPGFCESWDVFVQLGMTDDSYKMKGVDKMTHRDFTNAFLAYHATDRVELKLMHYLGIPRNSEIMERLEWLGMFEDVPIGMEEGSPAEILQKILEKKWIMNPGDKDMIVMFHQFGYRIDGELKMRESHMVYKGQSASDTAMARTVGLPVGITTRMILNGTIPKTGAQLPITPGIYQPVLKELQVHGITFNHREVPYTPY